MFAAGLTSALAERDDGILAAYVHDETSVSYSRLRQELAAQTKEALVHPVFFGSARTGAGVEPLMAGIAELLPAVEGDADGPVSGTVFKVERDSTGEKIAYARMFSGTLRTRDRLRFGRDVEGKVTAISVFDRGSTAQRASVSAGEIGKLRGLGEIRSATRSASCERPRHISSSPRRHSRPSSFPAAPPTRADFASRSRSSPSRIR